MDAHDTLARLDADKARLLRTPVEWTTDEAALALAIRGAHAQRADESYRLCVEQVRALEPGDAQLPPSMALALYHEGEALRWAVGTSHRAPPDFGAINTLMRLGMAAGIERAPVTLPHRGRAATCTAEALYFRALLFARFAGGVLTPRQAEILDAWIWEWMSTLQSVRVAPAGSALRVDLDSREGLRRGPRAGDGPSLYLPPQPIAAAYRDVVGRLQSGHMVPAEGLASEMRIEDHIAVLDLMSLGLREALRPPAPRAPRRAMDAEAQMLVGLPEIRARGFAPSAPSMPRISLVASDGSRAGGPRREKERDNGIEAVYQVERRVVRVLDASESGFGLEGDIASCGGLVKGDLVAIRIGAEGALEIGKVERCIPASSAGRVVVGVRRLTSRARKLLLSPRSAGYGARPMEQVFVPGDDAGGRFDAWLVAERDFELRTTFEAPVGDRTYALRMNRCRDRGRGWVLAGFEVTGTAPCHEIMIA